MPSETVVMQNVFNKKLEIVAYNSWEILYKNPNSKLLKCSKNLATLVPESLIHFADEKIRGFAVGKACPGDKELWQMQRLERCGSHKPKMGST